MNGKILIVDDSPTDIAYIQGLMIESSFEFDSVNSCEQCEAYLEEEIPMAILLDFLLNNDDPFEIIEKYHSKIPIILLTGFVDSKVGLKAVKKGAQDFLYKDSLNAELLEKSLNYSMERQILKNRVSNIEKMATVGRLSSGVAHEMNTPIQYVSDNIYFLEKEFSSVLEKLQKISAVITDTENDNVREDINSVLAEIDFEFLKSEVPAAVVQSLQGMGKLSKLVKALKNFAVAETNQIKKLNVNTVIQELMTSVNSEFGEFLEVRFSPCEEINSVLAEENNLRQVIENILDNSVYELKSKYKNSQDRGFIDIATTQNSHSLEIKISDSGNGISEDVLEHIFEPFFTTKRYDDSLGQGLAVVHRLIHEVFEGSIKAYSQEGQGAEFVINIPNMKIS